MSRIESLRVFAFALFFAAAFSGNSEAAVAPVGQLPSVTVSVTPCVYALPVLLVEDSGEWKDFGIQVTLKVYAEGEDQLRALPGNEWDTGLMDPFHAVKGANDGDVAIVGAAGNYAFQRTPGPFSFARKGIPVPPGDFLPACLVASSSYADSRKTLVIRWVEGYARGMRIAQKDTARAAARLSQFYRERIKVEIPPEKLEQEIREAFFFDDKARDEEFAGKAGRMAPFVRAMTDYQLKVKAIEKKRDPEEFMIGAVGEQLIKLRSEAEDQIRKTKAAIDAAKKDGAPVLDFEKKWSDANQQFLDGRGCLTVIGVLSDLQRSADQSRVTRGRLSEFRKIELGVGAALAVYYGGYFLRRRKKAPGKIEERYL